MELSIKQYTVTKDELKRTADEFVLSEVDRQLRQAAGQGRYQMVWHVGTREVELPLIRKHFGDLIYQVNEHSSSPCITFSWK